MITKRQRDVLQFIKVYTHRNGYCPNYDEIMQGIGLKSKSGVNRLVLELEQRGFIRRLPGQSRAIEILRLP
ncbi:MAG: hypothetical protein KGJ13_08835 [Patescibacteria group bacterium]|nr:hypothetical protein [Patescibacteria group bacterium]